MTFGPMLGFPKLQECDLNGACTGFFLRSMPACPHPSCSGLTCC